MEIKNYGQGGSQLSTSGVAVANRKRRAAETVEQDQACQQADQGGRQLSTSAAAVAGRKRRAVETVEQREARLQAVRERAAQRRAQEAHNERDHRLSVEWERITKKRAKETDDEREHRLSVGRERKAQRRAQEAHEEREHRLSVGRERKVQRRAHETADERENRLRAVRQRYQQRNAAQNVLLHTVVVSHDIDETCINKLKCGVLNIACEHCGAKHFSKEKPSDGHFTQCCQKGKIQLEKVRTVPLLQQLMTNVHAHSKNFMNNIRSFNSSLAFALMGVNIAPPPGYGPYCFRIHGQIYHRAGALHPCNDEERKYAQLYILDPESATEQRLAMVENSSCNPQLMTQLSTFMVQNNPFADACKMLHEVEQESIADAQKHGVTPPNLSMAIRQDRNSDMRRYNAPRCNEVAMIFQNADGEPPLDRDLLIHCRININDEGANVPKTQRVSVLDPNLEPLVYPLFFPYADQSWGINIPLRQCPSVLQNIRTPVAKNPRTRVTQMQYYSHRLSIRDEFNPFLSGGKLTQQYFVDTYVKTEANRLNYHRQNQAALRVDLYKGLVDHLNSKADAEGLVPGKAVILLSSFQGSPRNMAQNYQDAMAIVRRYGKPDLFITMTCNPKWQEITENILPGQSADCRPDLIARVFHLKLTELLDDIRKKHIFGVPTATVHVIEFQKRGLPHAHMLIILKQEHKPSEIDTIDKLVSAEIPSIKTHPRLHAIVTKHMIHGPCGQHNPNSPCMEDGKCSKDFPKDFQTKTVANVDGYPKYRRREDKTIELNGKKIDNRWVVPYNPYLSLKYNCHINVEICASVKSVKYLFKYVYKGHDCANVAIKEQTTLNHDEITTFIDSRYVSAPEAAWRLFGFNMHHQSHTIQRLQVHLHEEQSVYFDPTNIEAAVERDSEKKTTLTAWFELNATNENVRQYLYTDIPEHFVFDTTEQRKWKCRKRGGDRVIGRSCNWSYVCGQFVVVSRNILSTLAFTPHPWCYVL